MSWSGSLVYVQTSLREGKINSLPAWNGMGSNRILCPAMAAVQVRTIFVEYGTCDMFLEKWKIENKEWSQC